MQLLQMANVVKEEFQTDTQDVCSPVTAQHSPSYWVFAASRMLYSTQPSTGTNCVRKQRLVFGRADLEMMKTNSNTNQSGIEKRRVELTCHLQRMRLANTKREARFCGIVNSGTQECQADTKDPLPDLR